MKPCTNTLIRNPMQFNFQKYNCNICEDLHLN